MYHMFVHVHMCVFVGCAGFDMYCNKYSNAQNAWQLMNSITVQVPYGIISGTKACFFKISIFLIF